MLKTSTKNKRKEKKVIRKGKIILIQSLSQRLSSYKAIMYAILYILFSGFVSSIYKANDYVVFCHVPEIAAAAASGNKNLTL